MTKNQFNTLKNSQTKIKRKHNTNSTQKTCVFLKKKQQINRPKKQTSKKIRQTHEKQQETENHVEIIKMSLSTSLT